jgi:hypothetical protein
MWRKIPPPSKDDEAVLRMSKRMKLYADEDIEDDVVEFFRDQGVNVKGARELGHRGKPDSFHAALAFRERRFLVTRNGKHYWDDRAVPMNRTHGIIIVDADPRGFRCIWNNATEHNVIRAICRHERGLKDEVFGLRFSG